MLSIRIKDCLLLYIHIKINKLRYHSITGWDVGQVSYQQVLMEQLLIAVMDQLSRKILMAFRIQKTNIQHLIIIVPNTLINFNLIHKNT